MAFSNVRRIVEIAFFTLLAATGPLGGASAQSLLVTGVVDGPLTGGTPKAIELYAREDIPDLSIYGVGSANNGGGSDGVELVLSGSASAGQFFYVATESTQFEAFFGFAPDFVADAAAINGDDAVEVFAHGAVIDVFGEIAVDGTGAPWEHTDGWAYRNDGTGPDGATFVLSSWSFSGPNALDGETTNGTAAMPFPIGNYSPAGIDSPPTVAATTPADGAAGVALDTNITIGFSEAVTVSGDWFTIACTGSGALTATVSGGAAQFTLAPAATLAAGESCTVTVLAGQVTDIDGAPDALANDFGFTFTTAAACGGAGLTAISSIQGSGTSSPLVGATVSVEAVVTGDFQDGAGVHGDLNGFFLQDPSPDADPATSDGIFVFDGTAPALDVNPGDVVRVTGEVAEFFGETQIQAASVVACARTATVTAVAVSLPAAASVANADGELIADLEHLEGMLVTFAQPLTVTELFNLDRFGELRLAESGRLFQFTNVSAPSTAGFAAHLDLAARRNITLDDGELFQNPDPIRYPAPGLDTANPVRMGDTVTGLTGNVRFSRGSGGSGDEVYRLMPTAEPIFAADAERPGAPDVAGRLRVASFNVLNFFNDLDDPTGACFPSFTDNDCRGADDPDEFARQLEKLVTALTAIDADVYGLVEIENDYPDGPASSIATLVDALNAAAGMRCSGNFEFIDPAAATADGRIGDDAIAVGLIYCAGTVHPAPDTTPAVLDDAGVAALGIDPGDGVFTGDATSRAPLAATFEEIASGERFTVVVNHFKSKGASSLGGGASPCASDPSADENCAQGDGQGFWNARRTLAAEALAAWLAADPTGAGDPDVLVIGDLNAYLEEDPVTTLEAAGYVNVVDTLGAGAGEYSFVFDAQAGLLDHALATATMSGQTTDLLVWHINADESDGLDYNLDFGRNPTLFDGGVPFRASDHEPVVLGLDLRPSAHDATICSTLGRTATRPLGRLNRDALTFVGTAGERIEITLAPDPSGQHTGRGAVLIVTDAIRGSRLRVSDRGALPNRVETVLPADGRYVVTVVEQRGRSFGPPFRGDYCVDMTSSGDAASSLVLLP